MKASLNITLRKKKRIKLGKKGKETLMAAEWVDLELIENINKRSRLSRDWRRARKEGASEDIQKACKDRYIEQKGITSIMTNKKKGDWEIKKVRETLKDGKKFWTMMKELLGKNKRRDDENFIYTQEREKKEIMEIAEEYVNKWKQSIYQKTERKDFSFWYGKNGMMERMIEEEKKNDSGIMKFPKIYEEELIETIRNMKNRKATGVDRVSA